MVTKLQDSYHGNMDKFQTEFFYPAVNLLVKLKKVNNKITTRAQLFKTNDIVS